MSDDIEQDDAGTLRRRNETNRTLADSADALRSQLSVLNAMREEFHKTLHPSELAADPSLFDGNPDVEDGNVGNSEDDEAVGQSTNVAQSNYSDDVLMEQRERRKEFRSNIDNIRQKLREEESKLSRWKATAHYALKDVEMRMSVLDKTSEAEKKKFDDEVLQLTGDRSKVEGDIAVVMDNAIRSMRESASDEVKLSHTVDRLRRRVEDSMQMIDTMEAENKRLRNRLDEAHKAVQDEVGLRKKVEQRLKAQEKQFKQWVKVYEDEHTKRVAEKRKLKTELEVMKKEGMTRQRGEVMEKTEAKGLKKEITELMKRLDSEVGRRVNVESKLKQAQMENEKIRRRVDVEMGVVDTEKRRQGRDLEDYQRKLELEIQKREQLENALREAEMQKGDALLRDPVIPKEKRGGRREHSKDTSELKKKLEGETKRRIEYESQLAECKSDFKTLHRKNQNEVAALSAAIDQMKKDNKTLNQKLELESTAKTEAEKQANQFEEKWKRDKKELSAEISSLKEKLRQEMETRKELVKLYNVSQKEIEKIRQAAKVEIHSRQQHEHHLQTKLATLLQESKFPTGGQAALSSSKKSPEKEPSLDKSMAALLKLSRGDRTSLPGLRPSPRKKQLSPRKEKKKATTPRKEVVPDTKGALKTMGKKEREYSQMQQERDERQRRLHEKKHKKEKDEKPDEMKHKKVPSPPSVSKPRTRPVFLPKQNRNTDLPLANADTVKAYGVGPIRSHTSRVSSSHSASSAYSAFLKRTGMMDKTDRKKRNRHTAR